jgi:NADP-dependent 3-hydroxy acid dehydrogenase YdfG
MSERLDRAVALVTCAWSGMGEATARALAEPSAPVVLLARRKDRLEKIAAEIEERGGSALLVRGDVACRDEASGPEAGRLHGGDDSVPDGA